MDNNSSFTATRAHLIWAVCLPLAILVGYLLADPLDSSSILVFSLLAAVLSVPLLLRWHHPLLVLSWNAFITPFFFPGTLMLWMPLAMISLTLGVINRATSAQHRFLCPRSVTLALLCLGGVVAVTAAMTGGVGVRVLGAEKYGGRAYFNIVFAIIGFFALVSRRIPREQAVGYVVLFFLAGVTAAASNLIYMAGPAAYWLFSIFPAGAAVGQAAAVESLNLQDQVRIGGFGLASVAVISAMLCRFGFRGLLDLTRPWRAGVVMLALGLGLFSGYRSSLILAVMILGMIFVLERLHRTRTLFVLLGLAVVGSAIFIPQVSKLPLAVQRSLSFLPIEVDPVARQDARNSLEWRVQMWKEVWPDVPDRLLMGKGYAIDPNELRLTLESSYRGWGTGWSGATLAGDYHNGPLSLLMPLGGVGVIAFAWFLIAGGRVLYRNYRFGAPELIHLNRFLYGCFLVRIVYYLVVFGSFHHDLFIFTGLVGLSLSLNGGVARSEDRMDAAEEELA